MDLKTKELAEAAERHAQCQTMSDVEALPDDVKALCAVAREQAAQLELLASATKVGAGETLVLIADQGTTGRNAERRQKRFVRCTRPRSSSCPTDGQRFRLTSCARPWSERSLGALEPVRTRQTGRAATARKRISQHRTTSLDIIRYHARYALMANDTKTKKYKLQATLPAVGAAALQVLVNLEGGPSASQSPTLLGLIRAEVRRTKPGAWEKAIALEEQLAGKPFEEVVAALVELLMVELGGAP